MHAGGDRQPQGRLCRTIWGSQLPAAAGQNPPFGTGRFRAGDDMCLADILLL